MQVQADLTASFELGGLYADLEAVYELGSSAVVFADLDASYELGAAPALLPPLCNIYLGVRRDLRGRGKDFFPKRATESDIFGCDFTNALPAGVTIESAVWSVDVKSGIDANPNAMVIGQAAIAGPLVSTVLAGGVAGVFYWPRCTAICSDGQVRVLPDPGAGMLAVVA